MSFVKWVRDGIAHPRVAIYLKVIAVLMLLSALSHLGSIMGIVGGSWVTKPWLFRIADLLLLPISLVLAWGLWRTMFWAVVAWLVAVVLFQAVPFLLFGKFFALDPSEQTMHYGQVAFHIIMLGILLVLLPRKKGS
jgi:cytochrome c oxidase subunit IV